jgi:hypothetical protein
LPVAAGALLLAVLLLCSSAGAPPPGTGAPPSLAASIDGARLKESARRAKTALHLEMRWMLMVMQFFLL